jgi:hypothetical protein
MLNIVIALGTILAALVAFMAWRESHSDRGRNQRQEQIDQSLAPMQTQLSLLVQKVSDAETRGHELMAAMVSSSIQPLREDIRELKTQVAVFWKSVAIDAAKILHQPDPKRHMIDALLEAFMEDTLTSDEEVQLRKYLVTIRNWEPGQDVGFPIHPGEQTAAAILLSTMNHAMSPHHRERTDVSDARRD